MNYKKLSKIIDMANVLMADTGLDYDIRISSKEGSHGPRIKVYLESLGDASISVSISDSPEIVAGTRNAVSAKELNKISEWIIKNKRVLLDYWNSDRADTRKILNSLESV